MIILRHMDVLLNIESVSSSHNVTALRRLFDKVESNIRGLKALGVTPETYGTQLSPVLVKKLPHELRLLISRKVPDEEWSMDPLMEVLEEELKARERTVPKENPDRQGRGLPTSATLLTGSNLCCYCNQSHPSDHCKSIVTVEDRRQILKEAGRCFICLRKGHISRECRSHMRCSGCKGRHHISICYRGSGGVSHQPLKTSNDSRGSGGASHQPPSNPGNDRGNSRGRPSLDPTATPYESTSTTLHAGSSDTVLLQTAQAIVYNPVRVNIVLDCGSQVIYH